SLACRSREARTSSLTTCPRLMECVHAAGVEECVGAGAEQRAVAMSESGNQAILTFRCPKELDGLIPPPVPAAHGLPTWLTALPWPAFRGSSRVKTTR